MVQTVLEFLKSLTDPDKLLNLVSVVLSGWYGYALLFAIVFSETGLLVGFFLPGDSLLFTVGVVAGAGGLNIVWVNLILMAAAILGDSHAFFLGHKTGPAIFSRPDSRLFKQEYVTRTQAFYEKYGGKTIIIARFLPIVRTFAAFIAGVGRMPYLRFLPYSICGGVAWIFSLTMIGYSIGGQPFVRRNFDKVIIAIILISILPTVIEVLRTRREKAVGARSGG